jgi:hypothetical protein
MLKSSVCIACAFNRVQKHINPLLNSLDDTINHCVDYSDFVRVKVIKYFSVRSIRGFSDAHKHVIITIVQECEDRWETWNNDKV